MSSVDVLATSSNVTNDRVARSRISSKRIGLGILYVLAGWTLLVTIAARVVVGAVGESGIQPSQVTELFATMKLHGLLAVISLAAILVLQRIESLHPRWPRLGLVMTVLIFTLSSDRILAIVYPPPGKLAPLVIGHSRRGYGHRVSAFGFSSGVNASTNRFGFRGPPLHADKPIDEFRILFLGDSVMFGFMLPIEQGPVMLTERLLQVAYPDRNIRGVNAGISGYTTWQELDLLNHEGLSSSPDAVVLEFCINDLLDVIGVDHRTLNRREMEFDLNRNDHWSGFVRAAHALAFKGAERDRADAALWTQNRLIEEGRIDGVKGLNDVYRDPPAPAVTKAWNDCIESLERIEAICRENDLPFVLTYMPEHLALTDPLKRTPSTILRNWSSRRGVPFVDLTSTFRSALSAGMTIDALFVDSVHPTAAGAELIAQAIGDAIQEVGLITQPAAIRSVNSTTHASP